MITIIRTPPQQFFWNGRVIAWFSCGCASACASKLAITRWPDALVVNCDTTAAEHPDNVRFRADCERWLGQEIIKIKNHDFELPEDVFEQTGYISGPDGARCTTELKKKPRLAFAQPEDVHVFGFTADEEKRIKEFESRNPELFLAWPLRDAGIDKQGCYEMILKAGIKLPALYRQGYPHNNCLGCVKAASPGYWNKIRRDYPAIFKNRADQSRKMGVRLVKYKGERIFLDELPENANGKWKDEVISCGPDCASPMEH